MTCHHPRRAQCQIDLQHNIEDYKIKRIPACHPKLHHDKIGQNASALWSGWLIFIHKWLLRTKFSLSKEQNKSQNVETAYQRRAKFIPKMLNENISGLISGNGSCYSLKIRTGGFLKANITHNARVTIQRLFLLNTPHL